MGANLIGQHAQDRNQDATTYVGNLDPQVYEEMIWELFTQAGPVGACISLSDVIVVLSCCLLATELQTSAWASFLYSADR